MDAFSLKYSENHKRYFKFTYGFNDLICSSLLLFICVFKNWYLKYFC